MMLHRHFEAERQKEMEKNEDKSVEFESNIFPPDEPPKRKRTKKSDD